LSIKRENSLKDSKTLKTAKNDKKHLKHPKKEGVF